MRRIILGPGILGLPCTIVFGQSAGESNLTFEVASVKPHADGAPGWKEATLSMIRSVAIATLGSGIIPIALFAQSPHATLGPQEFAVASIKAVPPLRTEYTDESGQQHTVYQFAPGGRLIVRNGTLRFLITTAFRVKDFQIVGAPTWIDSERYDLEAKADTDTNPDGMLPMVQALLADRFGLALHRETRVLPAYRLVAAKNGQKLREHRQGNCRMPNAADAPLDSDNPFARYLVAE